MAIFKLILSYTLKYWKLAIGIIVILIIGYIGYGCGAKSRNNEISVLATQVAQNEKTIEIKNGLYATAIVQMDGLTKLLDTKQAEVAELKKQIDDSQTQLLTTQQLVIVWKKAYESALNVHQTPAGPSPDDPKIVRKRVDFEKDFGPIAVNGFTLTDPPYGFISIKQMRPLKLTVAVARNKNGTWNSFVTSSEPTMSVDVVLAGVDTGVLAQTWKQKIWLDIGTDFIGEKRISAGLSYHFDRISLGAQCSVMSNGNGCGLTLGFRLFK
jgi:hypothetical protein